MICRVRSQTDRINATVHGVRANHAIGRSRGEKGVGSLRIGENINSVKRRIGDAAVRVGRNPDEIKLVVVSKNRSVEDIAEVLKYGVRDIGENRVQEFLPKYDAIRDKAVWHFVGTLQRNKVSKVVGKVALVHSVDSLKLAEEIGKRATALGTEQEVLLEVNVSGESTKRGFEPKAVQSLMERLSSIRGIAVRGLMTVAPLVDNAEKVRPFFAELARLKTELAEKGYDLHHLSMGMTNDFEVAIEEGATIVRIGTAIFAGR